MRLQMCNVEEEAERLRCALEDSQERERQLRVRCAVGGRMLSESLHSTWSQGATPIVSGRSMADSEAAVYDHMIESKFGFKRNT